MDRGRQPEQRLLAHAVKAMEPLGLQDGFGDGIFGQRYGQIVPVELTGFTVK